MTIAFVSDTTATANASSTSITVTLASTVVGNLNIIGVSQFPGGALGSLPTLTPPSGWTVLGNLNGDLVMYRLYQSGDPTTVSVSSTQTNYLAASCVAYSGVDATTPVDSYALWRGIAISSSKVRINNVKAPSCGPNHANDMLVSVMCASYDGSTQTIGTPTGMNSRAANSYGPSVYIFDQQLSAAAMTGDRFGAWSAPSSVTTNYSLTGASILLKTSGDTTAGAGGNIFNAGSYGDTNGSSSATYTPTLSYLAPQVGDLVVANFVSNSGAVTPPAGWSLVQNNGTTYQFSTVWSSGQSTAPGFGIAGGANTYAAVNFQMYRAQNISAALLVDTKASSAATATSIASPTLTAGSVTELLHICYSTNTTSGTPTFTAPSGVPETLDCIWAPSFMVCDVALPQGSTSVPAYTATISASNALIASALLVKLLALPSRPMQMLLT